MWLIPYQKFTLLSNLSPDETTAKLEDNLYAQNDLTLGTYDRNKQFSGVVDDDKTFLIKRSLSDEEIALIFFLYPLISILNFCRFSGAIESHGTGCCIKIKAKMADPAMGGWGCLMALFITAYATSRPEYKTELIVKNGVLMWEKVKTDDPILFMYVTVVIYLVLIISFQIQVAITRRHFIKIFEAEAK